MENNVDPGTFREAVRILERRLGLLNQIESSCCGVTLAQCHAVVEIGRSGSISLGELASRLLLDKSTTSRTIQNLVESGMAARAEDASDRRFVTISLTEQGNRAFSDIETGMNEYFSKVFRHIPEEKRRAVFEGLELLIGALSASEECGCTPGTVVTDRPDFAEKTTGGDS